MGHVMTDYVDLVKEAKSHVETFVLWPRRWSECQLSTVLNWVVFPFEQSKADQIPDGPGIYAFLIQPGIASNLNASYLMYIGQTNSLRSRYRDYLREPDSPIGRPKIVVLLDMYRGFLSFSCAPLSGADQLECIEDALLGAYIPPANDQFPAQIRRIVNAF